MSYNDTPLHKSDLDLYFRELAKEFKRLYGKDVSAEIALIGGASVLIKAVR